MRDWCEKLLTTYDANTFFENDRDTEERVETLKGLVRFAEEKRRIPERWLPPYANLNLTLYNLLVNRLGRRMPIFKKIDGPCSISLFKSKDKTIYVIGELHGKLSSTNLVCQGRSSTIDKMIRQIAETTPAFLDIYVERPLDHIFHIRTGTGSGTLSSIVKANRACFDKKELSRTRSKGRDQRSPCLNARWHFIDIRNLPDEDSIGIIPVNIFVSFYRFAKWWLPGIRKLPTSVLKKLDWNDMIDYSVQDGHYKPEFSHTSILKWYFYKIDALDFFKGQGLSRRTYSKYEGQLQQLLILLSVFNDVNFQLFIIALQKKNNKGMWDALHGTFLENRFSKKELDRSYRKKSIIKFAKKRFKKYLKPTYRKYKTTAVTKTRLKSLELVGWYVKDLCTLEMDLYALARIFKRFNVPEGVEQPVEPYNILIYAGDHHADNQRRFLRTLPGFKEIATRTNIRCARAYYEKEKGRFREKVLTEKHSKTGDRKKCLLLKGFPQPFFYSEE